MRDIETDDSISGVVVSHRVNEIIRLEKLADDSQWEAARLIAEELADGKTQQKLAGEIGRSQPHVSYMAKTWREFYNLGYNERPPFNDAYHSPEVRGLPKPTPEPAPTPAPVPPSGGSYNTPSSPDSPRSPEPYQPPAPLPADQLPDGSKPCPADSWDATRKQLEMLLENYVRETPKDEAAKTAQVFRKMADKLDRKAGN